MNYEKAKTAGILTEKITELNKWRDLIDEGFGDYPLIKIDDMYVPSQINLAIISALGKVVEKELEKARRELEIL